MIEGGQKPKSTTKTTTQVMGYLVLLHLATEMGGQMQRFKSMLKFGHFGVITLPFLKTLRHTSV